MSRRGEERRGLAWTVQSGRVPRPHHGAAPVDTTPVLSAGTASLHRKGHPEADALGAVLTSRQTLPLYPSPFRRSLL